MVESVARCEIALPAEVVFDRLTALRNHERLIPFTTIRTPDRRPAVGDLTIATTAGLLDDTMELVRYEPPGRDAVGQATWLKRGPILLGEAEILVTPRSPHSCAVAWVERDIHLAGLPRRLTTRPLTALLGVMTRRALRTFARLSTPRHG